jgi:FkbM family methyltransferase
MAEVVLRPSASENPGPADASELHPRCAADASPEVPIFTIIPDHDPIELVAYSPRHTDRYAEQDLQTKRWFVENVQVDWTAFDVGADIGCYSILLSRLAPKGGVYAFEPTDRMGLLRRNLGHHRADNVRTLRVALGAGGRIGQNVGPITRPERPPACEFATIDQMLKRLDVNQVDCIRIDVNSAVEVLMGAERTLEQLNPWVVIALDRPDHSTCELLEWLSARGYPSVDVLDGHNLVLRLHPGARRSGSRAPHLNVRFEERPIVLRDGREKGLPLVNFFAVKPVMHCLASIAAPSSSDPPIISVPGPRWAYAASWERAATANVQGPLLVEVEVTTRGGKVGLGCISPAMDSYLGPEIFVPPASERQMVALNIPDGGAVGHLMLRNADEQGRNSTARIHRVGVFRSLPTSQRPGSPLLAKDKRRLSLAECEAAFSGIAPSVQAVSVAEPGIDIVPVEELGAALGFGIPFVAERRVYRRGLAGFQTEIDEAAIYAYIYRNAKPRRHLEFGTWEGFGVVVCARTCDAEIWTINLPEGEKSAEGIPLYGSTARDSSGGVGTGQVLAGDSGERIGWRYREAGFAPRVHQILCDSRDFDVSQFAPGFFDTILIDGGHNSDVMASDTRKALQLLRTGGIMIWHDFCPDVEVLRRHQAPRGVVRAVIDNFAEWRRNFSKMMWIRPSWMLIGVRL